MKKIKQLKVGESLYYINDDNECIEKKIVAINFNPGNKITLTTDQNFKNIEYYLDGQNNQFIPVDKNFKICYTSNNWWIEKLSEKINDLSLMVKNEKQQYEQYVVMGNKIKNIQFDSVLFLDYDQYSEIISKGIQEWLQKL